MAFFVFLAGATTFFTALAAVAAAGGWSVGRFWTMGPFLFSAFGDEDIVVRTTSDLLLAKGEWRFGTLGWSSDAKLPFF